MKFNRWLPWAFLLASLAGFVDSSYLAIKHYTGVPPSCTILAGCEVVTGSQYAVMFGVSVALLGALYYLSIFLFSVYYLDSRRSEVLGWISHLTWIGFAASLYFVYLQLFVIGSICLYCMGSAVTSVTLFVLGRIYIWNSKQAVQEK